MSIHQDITRLLELAASSISLLTLPQTDGTEDDLPQGEERSEQFVLEVSEYFERLDVCLMCNTIKPCCFSLPFPHFKQSIQVAIRSSLAHIRHSRIAPSAINAPSPGFIPPSLGVGLPADGSTIRKNKGLQEERVERDAWKGILTALTRIKDARDREERVNE